MRSTTTLLTLCTLSALMLVNLSPASADTMLFTHAGSGSGTLDGVPFTTSDFIVTATADTAFRESLSGGWFIDHTTAAIAIVGLGNLDILTGTRTFVNHQLVGFSRAGSGGPDLFNGPNDVAFADWDMLTPIGPISGDAGLFQWSSETPKINTSGGILIFNDGTSTGTFQAIPEPATLSLLVLGGLAVLRRRSPGRRRLVRRQASNLNKGREER